MEEKISNHRPALEFFRQMSRPGKVVFLIALLAVICVSAWGIYAAADPSRNLVESREVTDNHSGKVVISSSHQDYRSMDLWLNAFSQDVTFSAGLMKPNIPVAIWFVLLQALAWSLYLAALTYLRNIYAYVAMVPFAIVWYLSQFGNMISPGQGWAVSGGWILIILVFAFMLQNNMLRFNILLRFLLFLVLMCAPILLIWFQKGNTPFYISASSMYVPMTILVVVWLVVVAREPTHLLLLLATNAKDQRKRLPSPFLLSLWVVLLGVEFLMLADMMRLSWVPVHDLPFRPMHMLAVVSVISMFTMQNQHPRLGAMIPNLPFTIGVGGLSLFMISAVTFYTASGEHLFLYMLERLAAMVFFTFGVLYLFFVYYNFGPSIRDRVNVFFKLGQPKRLMYFFVILLGVLVCLAMEGAQGRHTVRCFTATLYDLEGDREMIMGNDTTALQFYKLATTEARTIKGNYNSGLLVLSINGDEKKAKQYFHDATSSAPFGWASITKANLELLGMEYISGKETLLKAWNSEPSPEIANNLAGIWLRLGKPDSAISALKRGINLSPDCAALYTALGNIYLQNGRNDWARKSFQQSLQVSQPDPAAITNALFFNLTFNDTLQIPANALKDPLILREDAAMINYSLHLFKVRDFENCQKVIDTLLVNNAATEASLVDGMLKFEKGRMDLAISRMEYIAGHTHELESQAFHFLGVMYFRQGVPEMAAEYFGKANMADTTDALNVLCQAQMTIDAGNHEKAFDLLKKVRVMDDKFFEEGNKETAMLFQARGQYLQAMLEYDLSKLNRDEEVRISRYAGQNRNYIEVLENFRRIMDKDSLTIEPQLEFARIYRRNQDTSAIGDVISNLQYALTKQPSNPDLKAELAYAQIARRDLNAAKATMNGFQLKSVEESLAIVLLASMKLAEGDTLAGLMELEKYAQKDPLNHQVNIMLSELYFQMHDYSKGSVFLFPLVNKLNYRNSDYWIYFARFQANMSDPEGAGGAALNAISLLNNEAERNALAKLYASEILLWFELHPELAGKFKAVLE